MTVTITDLVMRLVAAGAGPIEAAACIAEAHALGFSSRDGERDASRSVMVPARSKEAIRAERYRAKLKQNQALAGANDAANAGDQQRDGERDASRRSVTDHCDLSSSLTSLSGYQEVKKERKSARATRLLADAALPGEDRQFAIDHHVTDPDALWAEFVDFWIGVPGQRGTKLNWSATWRNRVRAVASKGKPNGPSQGGIIAAQRKLIAGAVSFGPRPSLIGSGASADSVRLLPERRGERSRDVHGGDHSDSRGVFAGSDLARHGPEDGDSAEDQMVADASRGR